MYRVLVVDDEPFIADSLAFMLANQPELELEAVKAYSAPTAIDMLNHAAFHIVVTDVEMPGQSGLDLLREIHAKWPSCQIVFLTGHDNFQYAHQAMRYNVARYVLKNEGDGVLLEAIEECVRRIKKEQANTNYLPNVSASNNYAVEKGKRELMRRHMESRQAANSLTAQWRAAQICLNPDRGVMLMAGYERGHLNEDMLDTLQAIVHAKIGHAVSSEVLLASEKLCIWLMQPASRSDLPHAVAAVKGLAEEIQEAIKIRMSIHITFVFAEEEIPWSETPGRIASLQDIARRHLGEHQGLALASTCFFEERNKDQDAATSGIAFVRRVLNHIQNHLGDDLSLTALSELVYLNPSYLSRRFKEITGRNLTDTILKLRMEEACRLLKGTADRVKNIGARLGYESAAHFSRIFKREMGIAPQEYRDEYGSKIQ
ncbi:MAG: response regulator [Clostridiales bacterium]|jgi:two-component system response regulator YesN|nr:response regulator [Clostridiales bacterium]